MWRRPLPDAVAERARAAGGEAMVAVGQGRGRGGRARCRRTATAFLADLGLTESARDRFIRASYGLLDLISFLTAGEDECRAWPIRRGTVARKAAGRIHSDIERGFIRAEVMAYDDFIQHRQRGEVPRGGEAASRGQGVRGAGRRHRPLPLRRVVDARCLYSHGQSAGQEPRTSTVGRRNPRGRSSRMPSKPSSSPTMIAIDAHTGYWIDSFERSMSESANRTR